MTHVLKGQRSLQIKRLVAGAVFHHLLLQVLEGQLPGQQKVEKHSQGPDIVLAPARLSKVLLRRDVSLRPEAEY